MKNVIMDQIKQIRGQTNCQNGNANTFRMTPCALLALHFKSSCVISWTAGGSGGRQKSDLKRDRMQ